MSKSMRWFFWSGLYAICLYFWLAEGNENLGNVVIFFTWVQFSVALTLVIGLMSSPSSDLVDAVIGDEMKPTIINSGYTFIVVFALTYHAHFVLGGVYLCKYLLRDAARERAKRIRKNLFAGTE